jgi:hypothetical protein
MLPRIIFAAATVAVVGLGFAGSANAQFFPGGGGFSSTSVQTGTDLFGNRRTLIRRVSDNGFTRCRSITANTSNVFGGSSSRTIRQCRPDF